MLELSVGFLAMPCRHPACNMQGKHALEPYSHATLHATFHPTNAQLALDRREKVWGAQPDAQERPPTFSRLSRRSQHSMQRFCRALLLCCAWRSRRYQD